MPSLRQEELSWAWKVRNQEHIASLCLGGSMMWVHLNCVCLFSSIIHSPLEHLCHSAVNPSGNGCWEQWVEKSRWVGVFPTLSYKNWMWYNKEAIWSRSPVSSAGLQNPWNFLRDRNIFCYLQRALFNHTRIYASEVTKGGPWNIREGMAVPERPGV